MIRPRPDGKKVRCRECDALVRPAADDVRPRRSGGTRQPQKSNALLIVLPIVAFVVLIAGGAIAYFALFTDKKTETVVVSTPAGGAVAKGPTAPPGAPHPGGQRIVGLQVGNLAPEIENEDLDGETFKLSDYRGKVVMLDFWGNW